MSLLRGFLSRSFGRLIATIWFLCWVALITWTTLAIYYSNLQSAGLRLGLAGTFAAFAVWALWLSRQRRMSVIVIALFLGVGAWWITIRPSHDRPWRPEVAVMPRAFIDGDRVRLTGVRNLDYRSRDEFTVRYEDREVRLSHLTALDFYCRLTNCGDARRSTRPRRRPTALPIFRSAFEHPCRRCPTDAFRPLFSSTALALGHLGSFVREISLMSASDHSRRFWHVRSMSGIGGYSRKYLLSGFAGRRRPELFAISGTNLQPDGQIRTALANLPVQSPQRKYFASRVGQITSRTPAVLSHRGVLRNVINAGRDAVDAGALLTNGADADGEVVWS